MLSFSVDVPRLLPSEPGALIKPAILEGLVHAAEQYLVPITWCLADWHEDWLIRRVRASGTVHEFAVLSAEEWAASRSRLVAELAEASRAASAHDVAFDVLALRGPRPIMDMDVLVRHRIRVVRGPAVIQGVNKQQRWAIRPLSARFGIWYAPVHVVAGKRIPWWCGGSRWLRLRITQLLRHGVAVHVTWDVGRASRDSIDLVTMAKRLFRWADSCRRAGKLQLALLSHVVLAQAADLELAAGMHSILRRSA